MIFIIPSNKSLLKLGLRGALMTPGGVINCRLFKIFNKSSGKPSGKGLMLGTLMAPGTPNPLIVGAVEVLGTGIEISLGEQGDIIYRFIILIIFLQELYLHRNYLQVPKFWIDFHLIYVL